MKRHLAYTVLLNLVALLVLSAPLAFLAEFDWQSCRPGSSFTSTLSLYVWPGYWIILAVIGVMVALLLLIPLDMAQKRPTPAWKRFVARAHASLLVGLLTISTCFSILSAFSENKQMPWVEKIGSMLSERPIVTWSGFWLIAALAFFPAARHDGAEQLVERTSRWLVRGSAILLPVAVTSYVITTIGRVCCVPGITFVAGIIPAVIFLLLACSPHLFFKLVARDVTSHK